MSRKVPAIRLPRMSTEYVIPLAMAVGALLALLIPNDLYDRSALVHKLTSAVTTVVPSVAEFARISNVPGTTRVTLAMLWVLVIPLAVALGMSAKTFPRPGYELRRFGWRPWLATIVLVIALAVVLPYVLEIPPDYTTGLSWDAGFYRFLARHPLAMGMSGGFYCWLCALLLGGLGRSLILVVRNAPDEARRRETQR